MTLSHFRTKMMILHRDVPLADVVRYQIGGPARYLIDVHNRADLHEVIEFIERRRPARLLVIGQGSNLIMPDDYFDGVVIRMTGAAIPYMGQHADGRVEVFAGARINDLARCSLDAGLIGLEWAGGLPGTVGAAVRGNAGAFGHEIARMVQQVEVISFGGSRFRAETFDRSNLSFSYRDSRLKHKRNQIVSSATVLFRSADAEVVETAKAVYRRNIAYRRAPGICGNTLGWRRDLDKASQLHHQPRWRDCSRRQIAHRASPGFG